MPWRRGIARLSRNSTGVAATPAAVVSTVNAKCPVSDHPIEAGFTAVVDGKTVGFCCDKCLAKFNKDPKAYAAKITAK